MQNSETVGLCALSRIPFPFFGKKFDREIHADRLYNLYTAAISTKHFWLRFAVPATRTVQVLRCQINHKPLIYCRLIAANA